MQEQSRRSRRVTAMLGFVIVLTLFGKAEAAVPATPTISVSETTLTPYISGGCFTTAPCYKVSGQTDPAVKVTVVVTDEFGKNVTASVYSAERDDPGIGVRAGDYSLAPGVTGLGTHDATPATLTFVAFAEDLAGNKSATSAPFTVTKYAVTPGDMDPPTLTVAGPAPGLSTYYPSMACGTGWCNFSLCLVFSIQGALPGRNPAGGCTGRYKMQGSADDLNSTTNGIASEIADVVLTVKNSSGVVVNTVQALGVRRGWQGFWAADILVADYEVGKSYSWSLVAIDASGNTSVPKTGTFTRYPL